MPAIYPEILRNKDNIVLKCVFYVNQVVKKHHWDILDRKSVVRIYSQMKHTTIANNYYNISILLTLFHFQTANYDFPMERFTVCKNFILEHQE